MATLRNMCSVILLMLASIAFVQSDKRIKRMEGGKLVYGDEYHSFVCLIADKGICTASIISLNYIITAAHCVKTPGTLGQYIIKAGEIHCDENRRADQARRSKLVIRHPRYIEGRVGGHDIALVQVDKPYYTYRNVMRFEYRPWPSKSVYNGQRTCFVTGWGVNLQDVKKGYKFFSQTRINVTVNHECKKMPEHLRRRVLCGVREKGKGVCFGDGGSILTCGRYAVGLVSMIVPADYDLEPVHFYDTCGSEDYQDIFTFFCPYFPWLNQVAPELHIFMPPQGCAASKMGSSLLPILAYTFLRSEPSFNGVTWSAWNVLSSLLLLALLP